MSTLTQYWIDEASRLDQTLGAVRTDTGIARLAQAGAQTQSRVAADAVRVASDAVAVARRALAGIPTPADGDPLLLAAGELVGVLVGLSLNAHPLEQTERPGFGLLRAQPQGMHRRHHQVFQHRHMGEEVELLKHHANPTLQAAQVGRGHRLAKQEQLAVVDSLQPVDGADQGRFSRA